MEKEHKKRFLIFLAIGAGLEFLVVLLTGVLGATPVLGGLILSINEYFAVWSKATTLSFICVSLYIFDIALLLANVILAILKKKHLLIAQAFCLFLAIAFLPFLFLMAFPHFESESVSIAGMYVLALLMVLNIAAIILLARPLKHLYRCKKCCKREEQGQVAGLSEEEVRQIVEQYLQEHKQELHQEKVQPAKKEAKVEPKEEVKEEPQPEPAVEEKKEEPAQEAQPTTEVAANPFSRDEIVQEGEVVDEDEYEIVEVIDENGQKVKVKRRRKANFETRLKGSEFDLRHKYYDLRDYLKWYGLSNRVSLPGDTFSYKRRKLAFITIIGKRIKFYIALDPAKYEDSPIPVERITAKKYADTPCLMKVRSDLSYRRAKRLIDDAMQEAGIARPEGDEPKETQHPENE